MANATRRCNYWRLTSGTLADCPCRNVNTATQYAKTGTGGGIKAPAANTPGKPLRPTSSPRILFCLLWLSLIWHMANAGNVFSLPPLCFLSPPPSHFCPWSIPLLAQPLVPPFFVWFFPVCSFCSFCSFGFPPQGGSLHFQWVEGGLQPAGYRRRTVTAFKIKWHHACVDQLVTMPEAIMALAHIT